MNTAKHIGIILDGNRRFAKKLMMQPWKGHDLGADKVRKLLSWIQKIEGINEVTLYSFSIQNFNRPKEEFDYLMKVFIDGFSDLCKPEKLKELTDNGIKIRFVGKLSLFPQELQEVQQKLAKLTEDNNKYTVNFAMAYGGREELTDAVKVLAEEVKSGKLKITDINEQTIGKHLWLNSEPDLIIRTGGEHRTSNFLPWQSTYSEWFFLEKSWPEFEEADLRAVIDEFSGRERRFGK